MHGYFQEEDLIMLETKYPILLPCNMEYKFGSLINNITNLFIIGFIRLTKDTAAKLLAAAYR